MLFVLLLLATAGLQGQTMKITDPVKYNDYIVDQQNLIGEQLVKLIGMLQAMPEDKSELIDQLEVLIAQCKSSISNVKNLRPNPNEFGLKQAALDLFGFYEKTMDHEYRQLIDEIYKEEPNQEVLNDILKNVTANEATFDSVFQSKQGEYAKYHNIQLEENQLQEEIDGDE